jgi:two-component system sensor histidine kinase CpxA
MRSLFLRIFVIFWLATLLIGASLVILALTTDPRHAAFDRYEARLAALGQQLVTAYESGAEPALPDFGENRGNQGQRPALLFRGTEGPLFGLHASRIARRLAAQASATGERQIHRGPRGLWLALPLGNDYVVIAEAPPPSRWERLLDPYGLSLRLGVAFVIIGFVSWFLARSFSAPIQRLRQATRKLAEGDLRTRVGSSLGNRQDEVAVLGRDFDRMAERMESLVEAQKRLLRDISHELRSPLARLNVALGLARQRAGAEAQGPLSRIEREAERLNELIGELLTLTYLEGGGEGAVREAMDLSEVVKTVAADADFEARNRDRSVRIGVCETLTVEGAPELLRRALENVVRNSIRFTADGTAVEISLRRQGGSAEITVRDHGPGVPEGALADLFRPFYRVADARDRQSGGTGIGLAITDRAVRLHGGSVRAENAPEGGLTVTLVLPLSRREDWQASA